MAEHAPANPLHDAAPVTEMTADDKSGGSFRFSPRGVPVITGINRVGLLALYMKEVRRFLKVQTQTIWAPAFTTLLFLVIFSVALGREGREVLGVSFASFVAPGLIVMAMMQNAFANSSFSLLSRLALSESSRGLRGWPNAWVGWISRCSSRASSWSRSR